MNDPHAQPPFSSGAASAVRFALTSVFWAHALVILAGPYSDLSALRSPGADTMRFYLLMIVGLQLSGSLLTAANRSVWIGISALAAQLVITLSVERSGSGLDAPGAIPQAQLILVQIAALACIVGITLIQSIRTTLPTAATADELTRRAELKPGNWRYI